MNTVIPPDVESIEFRRELGVIRVNEFTEESAKLFSEEMRVANNTDQPVIPVIVDSYGGSVDALSSMMSDIRNSDKPVATVAIGKAMSCGAILLSCGTAGLRFADPMSRIMIHEISSIDMGKTTDMVAGVEEISRMNKIYTELLSKNCRKRANFIMQEMKKRNNADWYLTAEEAQKIGLVDHVRIPKLTRTVDVRYSFE